MAKRPTKGSRRKPAAVPIEEQPANIDAIPPDLQSLATPIESLLLDPENARLHDERNLTTIRASLQRFGWRGLVVARRRDRMVLAGHGRIAAARLLGWTHAPVLFVDAEDREALAFALADNRTAELASWDVSKLAEAMEELDLNEIGWSLDELATIVNMDAELKAAGSETTTGSGEQVDSRAEYQGMPAYDHENLRSMRRIIVHFRSDEAARDFGVLIGQSVTEKTKSVWFPPDPIGRIADKAYVDVDEGAKP